MSRENDNSVRLFSYADDQAHESRGSLIPDRSQKPKHAFTPRSVRKRSTAFRSSVLFSLFILFVFAVAGTVGLGVASQSNLASLPSVTVVSPYVEDVVTLTYGPQPAMAKDAFFLDIRDAFIEDELSFVEVDISEKQLRYFKNGVLYFSANIIATGAPDSWWEVPSGLYRIEDKQESAYTTVAQIYLPWQLTFQGNFVIHGWPTYTKEKPVSEDYLGGGIRLSDEDAEELFRLVRVTTPVLVHASGELKKDSFIYKTAVPGMEKVNYLVADLGNDDVLATTDLDTVVPIASLTKLMTAVVASEQIDLDSRVMVTSPTFVTSLIPRLSGRGTVSMYSLLQLLLVESSNEAAETIAGELGREKFIDAMNAKARQLGMMQTIFDDPSGLSSHNVSSVGDLYKLVKYINENRRFIFEITAKNKMSGVYVGNEFSDLVNFNEIEGMDSFVGGKVGETLAAGQTSISLHKLTVQGEERTLAVILLGSEHRSDDVKLLVSYIEENYSE